MKIELPIFIDASSLSEVDAFLQRDGVFTPLRLVFDPRDVGAEAVNMQICTFAAPSLGEAVEAAERVAAARRRVAPIAALVDQAAVMDRQAGPLLAAMARVNAAAEAVASGTPGVGGDYPRAPSEAEIAALKQAVEWAWPDDARAAYFGGAMDAGQGATTRRNQSNE